MVKDYFKINPNFYIWFEDAEIEFIIYANDVMISYKGNSAPKHITAIECFSQILKDLEW